LHGAAKRNRKSYTPFRGINPGARADDAAPMNMRVRRRGVTSARTAAPHGRCAPARRRAALRCVQTRFIPNAAPIPTRTADSLPHQDGAGPSSPNKGRKTMRVLIKSILRRRLLFGLIVGVTVFGAVFAFAATLNVSSNSLSAGNVGVASCDPDG